MGESEFLDLNHTSKSMILVPYDSEVRSGRWRRGVANFEIGTLEDRRRQRPAYVTGAAGL